MMNTRSLTTRTVELAAIAVAARIDELGAGHADAIDLSIALTELTLELGTRRADQADLSIAEAVAIIGGAAGDRWAASRALEAAADESFGGVR